MKHREPDDFLKEILADEALDTLRENSLAGGLATLRTKRRVRTVRTALAAGIPLLVLTALVLRTAPKPLPAIESARIATVTNLPNIKIYPATAAKDPTPIPTISDDELLALFKDQSVGLLGTPGQQRLMVFPSPKVAMQ